MEIWVNEKETRIGLLLLDNYDKDWSWVVLGRRTTHDKFEGMGLNTSLPTLEAAKQQMIEIFDL
jgi:hypothetical protein